VICDIYQFYLHFFTWCSSSLCGDLSLVRYGVYCLYTVKVMLVVLCAAMRRAYRVWDVLCAFGSCSVFVQKPKNLF